MKFKLTGCDEGDTDKVLELIGKRSEEAIPYIWIGDNRVELRSEPKVPIGYIFGLDTSTLWRYHLSGFEWDDQTGSIWKQVAVGQGIKDAWYAYGRTEMELGCSAPQQNVVATGIDETVS